MKKKIYIFMEDLLAINKRHTMKYIETKGSFIGENYSDLLVFDHKRFRNGEITPVANEPDILLALGSQFKLNGTSHYISEHKGLKEFVKTFSTFYLCDTDMSFLRHLFQTQKFMNVELITLRSKELLELKSIMDSPPVNLLFRISEDKYSVFDNNHNVAAIFFNYQTRIKKFVNILTDVPPHKLIHSDYFTNLNHEGYELEFILEKEEVNNYCRNLNKLIKQEISIPKERILVNQRIFFDKNIKPDNPILFREINPFVHYKNMIDQLQDQKNLLPLDTIIEKFQQIQESILTDIEKERLKRANIYYANNVRGVIDKITLGRIPNDQLYIFLDLIKNTRSNLDYFLENYPALINKCTI